MLIDSEAAYGVVLPELQRLYHNHEFNLHLGQLQDTLNQRNSDNIYQRPSAFIRSDHSFYRPSASYDLPKLATELTKLPMVYTIAPDLSPSKDRLSKIGKKTSHYTRGLNPTISQPLAQNYLHNTSSRDATEELGQVVDLFLHSKSAIHRRYASELQQSIAAFRHFNPSAVLSRPSHVVAKYNIAQLQQTIETQFNAIEHAMSRPSASVSRMQVEWLKQGNLWPAITRVTILEQLRSTSDCSFGTGMKQNIIRAAVTITELQQQVRLESYRQSHEMARLEEEQANPGHTNWRPDEYPDWLLLEIESNLLIRETQVDVALAIIAPKSNDCSVLQLNSESFPE